MTRYLALLQLRSVFGFFNSVEASFYQLNQWSLDSSFSIEIVIRGRANSTEYIAESFRFEGSAAPRAPEAEVRHARDYQMLS